MKLVKAPFRMTVAFVPCTADTGLIEKSVGSPGVTVNPPTSWAISAPVVRIAVREPSAAPGLTVTFSVACVASITATELTAMPAPRLAVVVPFTKCVNCPTTLRSSVSAWRPVDGDTVVIAGSPAVTVKAASSVATSPSVVAVTLRAPSVADWLMLMSSVAFVGLVMSCEVTAMLPPKEKVVLPLAKCVFVPVTVTVRLSA